MTNLGAAGFHERQQLPEPEPEFAAGSVRGVRYWQMADDGTLRGQMGCRWQDGRNTASCLYHADHTDTAPVPRTCGCGFWAYWQPDVQGPFARTGRGVIGVVEGTGKTLIGDRGFRSRHARIIALACVFDVYAAAPDVQGPAEWRAAFPSAAPDRHPHADAIMSMFEDVLAGGYPGAQVFTSPAIMLRVTRPTRDYLPDQSAPPAADLYAEMTLGGPPGCRCRNCQPSAMQSGFTAGFTPSITPIMHREVDRGTLSPDQAREWIAAGPAIAAAAAGQMQLSSRGEPGYADPGMHRQAPAERYVPLTGQPYAPRGFPGRRRGPHADHAYNAFLGGPGTYYV